MAGITSKEIAKRLGLSPSAVSFALNGKAGVSEETRRLVIETAEKLGYNTAKLENTVKIRRRICFVIYVSQRESLAGNTTFSTAVLQGAENVASAKGHSILVKYIRGGEPMAKQLEDTVAEVDCFIILGTDLSTDSEGEMREFLGAVDGKPVVIIDSPENYGLVDCVINDNFGGARQAAEYLLSRGIKKIGYLRSRYRISNFEQREAGLRAALLTKGLQIHTAVDTEVSFDEAYKRVLEYIGTAEELPEAFFAENDIIAAAALRAFSFCGISVPQQISVIGFDDIPICDLTVPALSTVHSFKEQLGEVAVNLLLLKLAAFAGDSIVEGRGCSTISISTKLHIRDSVI